MHNVTEKRKVEEDEEEEKEQNREVGRRKGRVGNVGLDWVSMNH